ncbi:MAG: MATE family efflux transporter [Clostridia bacterium]|nr:MATE family efflux transporter [Clostridia bacterium]
MKYDILDEKQSARKIVLWLAWPTIISQVLQTLVTYVDTAMVGSLGVNATAAVGVNTQFIWVIGGFMQGLGVGFSVVMGHYIGEGRHDKAQETVRQSLICTLILGVVLTLLVLLVCVPNLVIWMGADPILYHDARAYLACVGMSLIFEAFLFTGSNMVRVMGDTRSPMVINILNNVINIILNFLFIYKSTDFTIFGIDVHIPGLDLGVFGAALGTAIAEVISGVLIVAVLFKESSLIHISIHDKYRFDKPIIQRSINMGVPVAFEQITLSMGQLVATGIVTRLGTAALAAHQLANTAESMCYMPMFGFSVAATTLVAQCTGAGKRELEKRYSRTCMVYGMSIMTFCAILMFIFAPHLIDIFIDDQEVISMGGLVLRIMAFAEPALAATSICSGILRGAGDTKSPFYVSIIGMWGVRVLLTVLFVNVMGLDFTYVWVAMALDWVVRAAIFIVKLKKRHS